MAAVIVAMEQQSDTEKEPLRATMEGTAIGSAVESITGAIAAERIPQTTLGHCQRDQTTDHLSFRGI